MENLWGFESIQDLQNQFSKNHPINLLKPHLQQLAVKTNNHLKASIIDLGYNYPNHTMTIQITAQKINNASFRILYFTTSENMFPIFVREAELNNNKPIECQNEETFLLACKKIIEKHKVRLCNILALSNSLGD